MDRKLEVVLAAKDQASKVVNQSAQSMGKSMDTLNHRIKSVVSSVSLLAGAYGLARLSKSFLEAATVTENYQVRLKVLLGSVEEGNRLFKAMNDYAGKVPFTFQEIMGSATQLAGVMSGGVDEVKKWMPLIGDLAAATGLGIQQTTEQVIRMYSAGAASADLFRERGITAMLGFQAGVHYSAEETRKQLIRAWEDPASKFRNSTGELAKTWTGLLSMMSDKWFKFRTDLMEAGTFEALKADLGEIVKLMGTWAGWVGEILKAYHDIVLDTDKIGIRHMEAQRQELQRQLDIAEKIYQTQGEYAFGGPGGYQARTAALRKQLELVTKTVDKWRLEKNAQEKGLETTKKQATALKDVSVNMDLVMVQAGLLKDDYRDIIANTEAWESSLADVAELASYALSDAFQEIDDSALYTKDQLKGITEDFAGFWDGYTKDARAANKKTNADFQHMMNNIQDIGANAFENIMDGSIKTWEDMWDIMKSYAIKTVAQIASQKIIVPIAAQLLGGGGIGGSVAGSVGGSILGKGGMLSGLFTSSDMGEFGLGFGSIGGLSALGSIATGVGAVVAIGSLMDKIFGHKPKPTESSITIGNQLARQYGGSGFDVGASTITYQRPIGQYSRDDFDAAVKQATRDVVQQYSQSTTGPYVIGWSSRDEGQPKAELISYFTRLIDSSDAFFRKELTDAQMAAIGTPDTYTIKWRSANEEEFKAGLKNWWVSRYTPYFNAIDETASSFLSEISSQEDLTNIQADMASFISMAHKIPEFWGKMGKIIKDTGASATAAYQQVVASFQTMLSVMGTQIQYGQGTLSPEQIKAKTIKLLGYKYGMDLSGLTSAQAHSAWTQLLTGNPEELASQAQTLGVSVSEWAADLQALVNSFDAVSTATQQVTDRVDGLKDAETTFARETISAGKAAYWNTLLGGGTDQQAMIAQLGVKYDWAKSGYSFSDVQNAIGNLNANDILDIAASFGFTFDEVTSDIRSVMDTMTDLGAAAVDTASRMQDAATEIISQETSIADAWQGVRSGTQSRISSMLYGSANPESAVNRLASLRQAIGSMRYDTPELASQYSSTLGQYLSLAQEAYQRPSTAYRERYGFVLSQLQGLDTFASARQDRALEIAQAQRDLLEKISDNTEGGGTVTIYADTMSPEELRDRVVAILQSDTGRVVIQNTAQGKI